MSSVSAKTVSTSWYMQPPLQASDSTWYASETSWYWRSASATSYEVLAARLKLWSPTERMRYALWISPSLALVRRPRTAKWSLVTSFAFVSSLNASLSFFLISSSSGAGGRRSSAISKLFTASWQFWIRSPAFKAAKEVPCLIYVLTWLGSYFRIAE